MAVDVLGTAGDVVAIYADLPVLTRTAELPGRVVRRAPEEAETRAIATIPSATAIGVRFDAAAGCVVIGRGNDTNGQRAGLANATAKVLWIASGAGVIDARLLLRACALIASTEAFPFHTGVTNTEIAAGAAVIGKPGIVLKIYALAIATIRR